MIEEHTLLIKQLRTNLDGRFTAMSVEFDLMSALFSSRPWHNHNINTSQPESAHFMQVSVMEEGS
jgi:hypothetical protein